MADIIFPDEVPEQVLGSTKLPSNVDLEWWKGDTVEFIIRLTQEDGTPISLVGTVPTAVVRQSFNTPTSYSFTCTVQNTNEIRIYLAAATSKTIPAGDYIWNLQVTSQNGDVRTYLAGDVRVYAEVDA